MSILKAPFKLIGGLSKVSGGIGKVATLGSLLLGPFFLASAGNAAAAAKGIVVPTAFSTTNGGGLGAFYSTLFANPLTGETGIKAGAVNMGNGFIHACKSGFKIGKAGFDASRNDESVMTALVDTWNANADGSAREILPQTVYMAPEIEVLPPCDARTQVAELVDTEDVATEVAATAVENVGTEVASAAIQEVATGGFTRVLTQTADAAFFPGAVLTAKAVKIIGFPIAKQLIGIDAPAANDENFTNTLELVAA